LQLTLKGESGVACALEGLDNVDLEAFRRILTQNHSEAECEELRSKHIFKMIENIP